MAFTKLLRKATKSTRAAVKAAEEAAERAAKKKKKTAPKPKRGGKQVELEGARANPETGGSDKVARDVEGGGAGKVTASKEPGFYSNNVLRVLVQLLKLRMRCSVR